MAVRLRERLVPLLALGLLAGAVPAVVLIVFGQDAIDPSSQILSEAPEPRLRGVVRAPKVLLFPVTKCSHERRPRRVRIPPVAVKTKKRPDPRIAENDGLVRELQVLLAGVKAGEFGLDDFSPRLDAIHRAHLGDAANEPELAAARRKAGDRHADYVLSIERHHGLERLARALGIESESTRSLADGH
jgi:hypothetical protein